MVKTGVTEFPELTRDMRVTLQKIHELELTISEPKAPVWIAGLFTQAHLGLHTCSQVKVSEIAISHLPGCIFKQPLTCITPHLRVPSKFQQMT